MLNFKHLSSSLLILYLLVWSADKLYKLYNVGPDLNPKLFDTMMAGFKLGPDSRVR